MKILIILITTIALSGCTTPINESPKFRAIFDPPSNYFVCEKCQSLEGECYIKASSIKKYRTKKGLYCRHEWKRVSRKEFYKKWKNRKNFNKVAPLDQISASRKSGK